MSTLDKAEDLKRRTKNFAIRIVQLFRSLPHSPDAQTLGRQLLRSGTSVAANYRSVCRARSRADFIAKMGVSMGFVHHSPAANVTMPDPKDRVAYGKYVMHLGHCEECHALGSRGAKDEGDDTYMG